MAIARLAPVIGPDTEWWRTSRRRIFLDAHTPDWSDEHQRGEIPDPTLPLLSDVSPEADLERMADAGVDSVVLFAKCQYGNSYYPTRVGRRHSELKGRDLFGDQLRAAHSRGIRVIAYFSNMWDTAAAGAHPDWRLTTPESRPSTARWPALCLLSGYRDFAVSQAAEIARDYPIDGFWSDILTAGPCACHRCSARFRSEYGRELPAGPGEPGWLDLVHMTQDILAEYLSEQRAALVAERPHVAFIPNYYATTFVDAASGLAPAHLQHADIGSSEGYTDWHGLGYPSFAASYVQAGMDGGPTEVLVSRFVHTWDFTLRSAAQMRFEAFTVAAHGSTVSVDDQPYATGAIEPEVYRRLTPVFERIAERSGLLDGARPERYAGIYSSQTSRELETVLGGTENGRVGEGSALFPPSQPRSSLSDLAAAVSGTYRALVESHLPVALVDDRAASIQRLGEFPVLVLPDVLAISPVEADALTRFVENGGGLVATGPTAVRASDGSPLRDSPLRELLGVTFGGSAPFSYSYLNLVDRELADALGRWPIPHYGGLLTLESAAPDVRVLATRMDPVLETDAKSYWHNNQPAPRVDSGVPAIVERTIGRGRVIVSAARLGNNRARLGNATYRDLLAALVTRAAGAGPDVRVDGDHHNTEIVLMRRGEDRIVHLITGAPVIALDVEGARQPSAIEDVARIASVTLHVPPGTRSVSRMAGPDEVSVPLSPDGSRVTITEVDDWETLVLR